MPNLANKLCELAAARITVTFPASLKSFPSNAGFFYRKSRQDKIVLTGNPFREELHSGSKERAIKFFGLSDKFPVLLVLGGGTGAEFLNNLIYNSLSELTKTVQIIHSTGAGKLKSLPEAENYYPYEFIENMADAYAVADFVLTRAGLSTITELSNLKKLSIIVPLPDSPQEVNALYLRQAEAAIILNQNQITSTGFVSFIRKLLFEREFPEFLKHNIGEIMPKDANRKIADIIIKLAETSSVNIN